MSINLKYVYVSDLSHTVRLLTAGGSERKAQGRHAGACLDYVLSSFSSFFPSFFKDIGKGGMRAHAYVLSSFSSFFSVRCGNVSVCMRKRINDAYRMSSPFDSDTFFFLQNSACGSVCVCMRKRMRGIPYVIPLLLGHRPNCSASIFFFAPLFFSNIHRYRKQKVKYGWALTDS